MWYYTNTVINSTLRVVVDTHLKEIADDGGFELRLCPTILPPNLPVWLLWKKGIG